MNKLYKCIKLVKYQNGVVEKFTIGKNYLSRKTVTGAYRLKDDDNQDYFFSDSREDEFHNCFIEIHEHRKQIISQL